MNASPITDDGSLTTGRTSYTSPHLTDYGLPITDDGSLTTDHRKLPPDYPEPSPELIADIRNRLAQVPPDVLERAHHALMHEHIDRAASILYRAGACFCSAELYEYRKTLFPPNALVDPLTVGPPVLRNPPEAGPGACGQLTADNGPLTTGRTSYTSPHPTDDGLSSNDLHPSGIQEQTTSAENLSDQSSTHPAIHPSATDAPDQSINHQPSAINSAGASLLNDLRSVLGRYLVLPEMAAEALALWVVHTYAFTLRQVTTYIGVVSPEKRCGKTTLLELLGRLASRSLTAANISPSAMFRVIEQTQPTLLIDEADTFLEGRDELAGILNAGYRKGNAYVLRVAFPTSRRNGGTSYTSPQITTPPNPGRTSCTSPTSEMSAHSDMPKNLGRTSYTSPQSDPPPSSSCSSSTDHGQLTADPASRLTDHDPSTFIPHPSSTDLARFSTWCPKVMAAIGRLPDTLADRCIVITKQSRQLQYKRAVPLCFRGQQQRRSPHGIARFEQRSSRCVST